jgi:hypothetical protein
MKSPYQDAAEGGLILLAQIAIFVGAGLLWGWAIAVLSMGVFVMGWFILREILRAVSR